MMKKILLALALVSATSLFADMAQWFNATPVPDTEVVSWSLNGEDGSVITNLTDTAYWEIDADVTKAGGEEATVFTPPAQLESGLYANTITRVDISTTFDAMYDMTTDGYGTFVGEDQPLDPPDGSLGALVIGSVTNTDEVVTSSNFYAYVGSTWKKLGTGEEVPQSLTGDVAHVRIELLYLYGFKKLRYSIGTVVGNVTNYVALADAAGETLFPFVTSGQNITGVEFSGCGKVHQVAAAIRNTERVDGEESTDDGTIYHVKTADSFYELQQKGSDFAPNGKVQLFDDFTLDSWSAIGKPGKAIQYNFDGDRHTITVKNLNGSFFGELYNGVTIENLTIDATNAVDNVTDAAIFASTCPNNVTFRNCTAAGHLYNTTTETGKLSGFVLYANAADPSTTSVTFDNCLVTAELNAANAYAFVAVVGQGKVKSVVDTTIATVGGYESYGALDSAGSVDCAFNFCTNDTIDEVAYTFYVEPALSDDPDNCSYIVKKPSADDFEFNTAGYLTFVRPDNDQEHPVAYTGSVTAGDDFVVDYYAPNTPYYKEYTIGNCVATWVSSDGQTTIKYASVAKALNDTTREAGGTVALYTANPEVDEWVLEADATVAGGVTFDLDTATPDSSVVLTIANGKTLTVKGTLNSKGDGFGDISFGSGSAIRVYWTDITEQAKIEQFDGTGVSLGAFIAAGEDDAIPASFARIDSSLSVPSSIKISGNGESALCYSFASDENGYGAFYINASIGDFEAGDKYELGYGPSLYFTDSSIDDHFVLSRFDALLDDETDHDTTPIAYGLTYDQEFGWILGCAFEGDAYFAIGARNYLTFEDALTAANDGDTITICGANVSDANATINKSIALALGDYTIAGNIIVGAGKTLTIAGIDPTDFPEGLTITGVDNTAKLNNGDKTYTWNNGAWQAEQPPDDNVCQILDSTGEFVAKYMTLQEAITAAENGQTIQLINNINLDAATRDECALFENNAKTLTFDLNGHTIEVCGGPGGWNIFYNSGSGVLTMKDSVGTGYIRATSKNPDAGDWSSGFYIINNSGTGVLNIESGVYDMQSAHNLSFAVGNSGNGAHPVLNITGGTFKCANYTAIHVTLQSAGLDNTINISGNPEIQGKRCFYITYPTAGSVGSAKITIDGGAFTAWERIFQADMAATEGNVANLIVNGGTFTCAACCGKSLAGDPAIFHTDTVYAANPIEGAWDINVQGGTFTVGRLATFKNDISSEKQIATKLAVYGGTFDTEAATLAAYVNANFYDITENGTTRTVAAKPAENEGVFDVNGSHGEDDQNHGLIKITEEQLQSLPECSTYTLAGLTPEQKTDANNKLNGSGANGLPRWQSIVLGITDFAAKPTVKATQDIVTDRITFKLGVTPASNTGAKIRYCLSDDAGGVKEFDDATGISISVADLFDDKKVEHIKVKIIIDQVNERPVPANN